MQYRKLGRSGMDVSEIGFGAWAIGGSWGPQNEQDSVAALHKALHGNSPKAVLKGQGGFGKSTLARHYAQRHGAEYHGGVWTHAGTRQAVIDGLMALNIPLDLEVPARPQMQHAQAVVAKVAASGKAWLFIYDNVEAFDDINDLIPHGAHVIVTTRQGAGGRWAFRRNFTPRSGRAGSSA